MGSNKKDLRAYVRIDGSGRVVAGSLILRRKKPKVGKWLEIKTYECCDNICPPLVYGDDYIVANIVPGDPGFANIIVLINPFNPMSIQGALVDCNGVTTNISGVLSTPFPAENIWVVPEGDFFNSCSIKFRRVCEEGETSVWTEIPPFLT